MLRNLKDLRGYTVSANDGEVGKVTDFYFDDDRWVVRYLIVETGSWLSRRKVLISPMSIGEPQHAERIVPVTISRAQVQGSPDIDTDKPVSRQREQDYLGYYGYPAYWDSVGIWGMGSMPGLMMPVGQGVPAGSPLAATETLPSAAGLVSELGARTGRARENADPHLRSCERVTGYHIRAEDGEIGHVQDWVLDETSWAIRYLVVATSNWWVGHKVLVPPQWIDKVSWAERYVGVHMTQNAIRQAPAWDPAHLPDRDDEVEMFKHYDRAGYW